MKVQDVPKLLRTAQKCKGTIRAILNTFCPRESGLCPAHSGVASSNVGTSQRRVMGFQGNLKISITCPQLPFWSGPNRSEITRHADNCLPLLIQCNVWLNLANVPLEHQVTPCKGRNLEIVYKASQQVQVGSTTGTRQCPSNL